jgi:signal transduction histidine kinase
MSEHPDTYGLARPDGSPYPADTLPSARALAGEVVLGEELVVGGPGPAGTPVLVNAAPVRGLGGQVSGAVVVMQDISRIKGLERQREEFVSIIAHDLRTPIGIIQTYAHVLQRAAESRTDATAELNAIRAIAASASGLGAMVNDLLDASRIEADRLSLAMSPVDLCALAQGLVERLGPVLGHHAVRLGIARDLPEVTADPSRVEQILTNLLTNAAKYSPEGTDIAFDIEHADGEAVVSVRDRGPGIAREEQAVLFDRFFRARSARAGAQEGLGLGLYICRGLVEAQGGRIWVESAPGEGSCFRFTLPLARRADSVAA